MPVYYSLLISILFSFDTLAKVKCEKLEFVFQEHKGIQKGSDEFCFKDNYYYSSNCVDGSCFDKKKIIAMKKKRVFDIGNYNNKVGTREFKICHKLGGKGQILSIKRDNRKVKTARCFLNSGFVEANYLELIYLKGL